MSELREAIRDRYWARRVKVRGKPRKGPYAPTMLPKLISLAALSTLLRKSRGVYRR